MLPGNLEGRTAKIRKGSKKTHKTPQGSPSATDQAPLIKTGATDQSPLFDTGGGTLATTDQAPPIKTGETDQVPPLKIQQYNPPTTKGVSKRATRTNRTPI